MKRRRLSGVYEKNQLGFQKRKSLILNHLRVKLWNLSATNKIKYYTEHNYPIQAKKKKKKRKTGNRTVIMTVENLKSKVVIMLSAGTLKKIITSSVVPDSFFFTV